MTKVHIKTFGCSLNHSDSEQMAAVLEGDGYTLTENEDEADVVVLNSCAVKGPTESKFFTLLEKLKKQNKKVVVGGCIPQSMPEKLVDVSAIGTEALGSIGEVVSETEHGRIKQMLEDKHNNKLTLPSKRSNPLLEIIPISTGCLSNCTYCITKKARGNLTSYPIADILERVRKAKHDGVKEIYLTSPDNGCYGFDIKTNLAELVKEITTIKGDFKLRIGMGNPQHFKRFLPEFVEALKNPQVYTFVHIPSQAGDNTVLRDMLRGYTIEQYEDVVLALREEFPELMVATDIIVGFPTETEEQFQRTLDHLERVKPEIVNLSRFWPRPHTPAADLPELPGDVVKDRSKRVTELFTKYMKEKNSAYVGKEIEVQVTEKGKEGDSLSRTQSYKQVVIKKELPAGSKQKVKIVDYTQHYLVGEIIDVSTN